MKIILNEVTKIVKDILETSDIQITKDTVLLGEESPVKSRELVEILLELEDLMDEEFSIEFDWSSNSAMSEANSNYRTIESLSDHLKSLVD